MATTVNLKELGDHLRAALGCVDAALDSAEPEPALDFESVRAPLREALKLVGGGGTGAADSARGYGGRRGSGNSDSFYAGLDKIFLGTHPYRNHE